jgi:hypothetical protein
VTLAPAGPGIAPSPSFQGGTAATNPAGAGATLRWSTVAFGRQCRSAGGHPVTAPTALTERREGYACADIHEEDGANVVALIASTLIGVVGLVLPYRYYAKRRPVGAWLSWGEAMIAATWAFLMMFWWYGVVPHQWLTLADNEWNWRPDRYWEGPSFGADTGILAKLPFVLHYQHARDFIAVGIYIVVLGLNGAIFVWWQSRGKKVPSTEIERSDYGRPLVRA